jgi:hypothetical protein
MEDIQECVVMAFVYGPRVATSRRGAGVGGQHGAAAVLDGALELLLAVHLPHLRLH